MIVVCSLFLTLVDEKNSKCGGGSSGGGEKQWKCGGGGGGGGKTIEMCGGGGGGGSGGKLLNFIAFKTISMRNILPLSQSTFCS